MIKYQDYLRLFNLINKCYQGEGDAIGLETQNFEGLVMSDPKKMSEVALDLWEKHFVDIEEYYSYEPVRSFEIKELEDYIFFIKIGGELKQQVYKRLLTHLSSLTDEERITTLAAIYGFISILNLSNEPEQEKRIERLKSALVAQLSVKNYSDSWIVTNTILDVKEAIELACELIEKYDSEDKLNQKTIFLVTQLRQYIY